MDYEKDGNLRREAPKQDQKLKEGSADHRELRKSERKRKEDSGERKSTRSDRNRKDDSDDDRELKKSDRKRKDDSDDDRELRKSERKRKDDSGERKSTRSDPNRKDDSDDDRELRKSDRKRKDDSDEDRELGKSDQKHKEDSDEQKSTRSNRKRKDDPDDDRKSRKSDQKRRDNSDDEQKSKQTDRKMKGDSVEGCKLKKADQKQKEESDDDLKLRRTDDKSKDRRQSRSDESEKKSESVQKLRTPSRFEGLPDPTLELKNQIEEMFKEATSSAEHFLPIHQFKSDKKTSGSDTTGVEKSSQKDLKNIFKSVPFVCPKVFSVEEKSAQASNRISFKIKREVKTQESPAKKQIRTEAVQVLKTSQVDLEQKIAETIKSKWDSDNVEVEETGADGSREKLEETYEKVSTSNICNLPVETESNQKSQNLSKEETFVLEDAKEKIQEMKTQEIVSAGGKKVDNNACSENLPKSSQRNRSPDKTSSEMNKEDCQVQKEKKKVEETKKKTSTKKRRKSSSSSESDSSSSTSSSSDSSSSDSSSSDDQLRKKKMKKKTGTKEKKIRVEAVREIPSTKSKIEKESGKKSSRDASNDCKNYNVGPAICDSETSSHNLKPNVLLPSIKKEESSDLKIEKIGEAEKIDSNPAIPESEDVGTAFKSTTDADQSQEKPKSSETKDPERVKVAEGIGKKRKHHSPDTDMDRLNPENRSSRSPKRERKLSEEFKSKSARSTSSHNERKKKKERDSSRDSRMSPKDDQNLTSRKVQSPILPTQSFKKDRIPGDSKRNSRYESSPSYSRQSSKKDGSPSSRRRSVRSRSRERKSEQNRHLPSPSPDRTISRSKRCMADSQSPKRSRKKRKTSTESNERETESFSPAEDFARAKLLDELRRSTLSLESKLQLVVSSVVVAKSEEKQKEPQTKKTVKDFYSSSDDEKEKRKAKKKKAKKQKKRRRSSSKEFMKRNRDRSESSERKKKKKSKRKITLKNQSLEVKYLLSQKSEQEEQVILIFLFCIYI